MKKFMILIPIFLLMAGLYFVPLRIMQSDLSMIPGDLGDARFNNYILEHGYKYLIGDVPKFWDAPFMYPATNVIAYSDNLLGTLPIYSLFRILSFDRETAFQLWILCLFALNFIVCYLVLKKWSENILLSATGAYIFAFSVYILGHITNVQVFPKFIIPAVFFWSWQYLTTKQYKYFLYLTLGIAYQFYCGMYLGFYLVYVLFFFNISYFIIYRDTSLITEFRKLKVVLNHFLIVLISLVALLPLAIPYLRISGLTGVRAYTDVESSIPLLKSYFVTSPASRIWSDLLNPVSSSIENYWCHILFPGGFAWLGIIGIIFILILQKGPTKSYAFLKFLGLSLLLSIIFSLNFNNFSLYYSIYKIPGFDSLRAVNRIMNVEIILFTLIFVFVFDAFKYLPAKFRKLLYFLPLLVVIDNLIIPEATSRFNKKESQQLVTTKINEIKHQTRDPKKPIAYIPLKLSEREYELYLSIMIACQNLNVRCVNGYSGSTPHELIDFYCKGNIESLEKWCNHNNINISDLNIIYETVSGFEVTTIDLLASNGFYVCADHTNNHMLVANRKNSDFWESFRMLTFENNQIALISSDHYFVCSDLSSQSRLVANRKIKSNWETFEITWIDSTHIALSDVNGMYITVDPGSSQLLATSPGIGKNEIFQLHKK